MRHLVYRTIAGMHPYRWLVWVVHVVIRVVIEVVHVHHRAFRQNQWFPVAVDRLAIDIPVRNSDKRNARSTGQRRPGLQAMPQVVRVRINTQEFDGYGQPQRVLDGKCVRAGWNVERLIVLQLQQHRLLRRRLVGEVKPYFCEYGFGLSGGFQVHVQDQVGTRIDLPLHPFRFGEHRRIGLPEEEMAIGSNALPASISTSIPGTPAAQSVGCCLRMEAVGVEQDVGVVDDLRRTRADLDSPNVARLLQRVRKDEVAEDVLFRTLAEEKAAVLSRIRFRWSVLPFAAVRRGHRRLRQISLGHACLDPLRDLLDVRLAQPALVSKCSLLVLGQPGAACSATE